MTTEPTTISPKELSSLLIEIPDSPKALYYKGVLPKKDAVFLAVVGSRAYSEYGKKVCETLVRGLSGYNISIVSGLALGIDSIAHKTALEVGLHTIAVPGSGLDESVIYPSTHRPLAKRILDNGGLLLSEFDPKTKAAPYMFPQRNRIIAGLSHAVLIVEAEQKSGTLITARLAMEYNRDVLTVPGSLYSSKSKGPHHLLKNGAALIESPDDILEALDITPREQKVETYQLSTQEKMIVENLTEPLSKDSLVATTHLPISEIDIALTSLELKGLVQQKLGKITKTA